MGAMSALHAQSASALTYQACHQVLDTAELLEMILLEVHTVQHLFPQRVAEELDQNEEEMDSGDEVDDEEEQEDQDSDDEDSEEEYESEGKQDPTKACSNMKTLLLSQRVNQMFRGTIKGSEKLQQALWLKSWRPGQADELPKSKTRDAS